jgi:hypothetical protein
VSGSAITNKSADFTFFAHDIDDLAEKNRHIKLTAADLHLINPNTHTCPIFRSRRDAELTKAIYRRVPVLVDRKRREGGNPWGVRFVRMFDQTNDAELFTEPEKLKSAGFRLVGNRWTKGDEVFLPLYEAKMIQAYDHRAASVIVQADNWVRQGQTEAMTLVSHQNPEHLTQPRWWVNQKAVDATLGESSQAGYLAYKDVTSATNQRTMIAAIIPRVAVVNSAPLMLVGNEIGARRLCCLLGNLNSFALDFVARQKVGGVHLNFFIVEQLPLFAPDHYDQKCPWKKRVSLGQWISERVLKLSCTAEDLAPFALAAGFEESVHKWNASERAELTAELDAAFFLLYGIERADAEYILSGFQGLTGDGEMLDRFESTADSVLAAYDRLAEAASPA